LVYSKEEGTIVVFKDLTLNCCCEGVWEFDAGDNFLEHGAEGQKCTQGRAEGGVFGLKSGQGNLILEVGLPQDTRTSAESDNASSLGLCGGQGTIPVASMMKASEVGVDVTVDIQVSCGFNDHPPVASAVQVADESLDRGIVTLLWVLAKSSNLADGEGDVRESVSREVKHHTNNEAVTPNFFHGGPSGSIRGQLEQLASQRNWC
jgi:hypothetical protein